MQQAGAGDTALSGHSTSRTDSRILMAGYVLIGIIYVFYGWDRLIMAVELVDLKRALGLTPGMAGLMASIFTLGIAIMSIPASLFVLRMGMRRALAISTLVFSLSTLVTGLSNGVPLLFASRLGTGAGEAVFSIAMFSMIASTFPNRRGTAIGAATALFGLAMFIGPITIIHLENWLGQWRAPFILMGGVGSAGAIALFFVLPRHMADEGGMQQPRGPRPAILANLHWARTPDFMATLLIAVVNGLGCYAYMSMFQTYARETQALTPTQISVAFGFFGIGTVLGGIPIGYLLDRTDRRVGLVALLCAEAVMGYVTFNVSFTPLTGILLSAVLGMVIGGIYGNCYALIQEQAPAGKGPLSIGILLTFYYISAAFSGYIFVRSMGAGFHETLRGGLTVYTVPCLIAAVVVTLVHARTKRSATAS